MYRLFVYGILKERFEGTPATIKAKCYNLGAYPAITELGSGHKVHGKIITVDAETLEELDAIEGFPYLYHRQIIEIDGVYCQVYVYTNADDLDTKTLPICVNF